MPGENLNVENYKEEIKNQEYENIQNDIKLVVDFLNSNDAKQFTSQKTKEQVQEKIANINTSLDNTLLTEMQKDKESFKNIQSTVARLSQTYPELYALNIFFQWKKEGDSVHTFESNGKETAIKLNENLDKDLGSIWERINRITTNDNLKTTLTNMLNVIKWNWVGTRNLQKFLFDNLPIGELTKESFFNKNKANRTLKFDQNKEYTATDFDGKKWLNTVKTFINVANKLLDDESQRIEDNTIYEHLLNQTKTTENINTKIENKTNEIDQKQAEFTHNNEILFNKKYFPESFRTEKVKQNLENIFNYKNLSQNVNAYTKWKHFIGNKTFNDKDFPFLTRNFKKLDQHYTNYQKRNHTEPSIANPQYGIDGRKKTYEKKFNKEIEDIKDELIKHEINDLETNIKEIPEVKQNLHIMTTYKNATSDQKKYQAYQNVENWANNLEETYWIKVKDNGEIKFKRLLKALDKNTD